MRDLVIERISFFRAISRYLVIAVLATIVSFIVMLLQAVSTALTTGMLSLLLGSILGIIISTVLFPIGLLVMLVVLYVFGFIVFALARLLGGKGGYFQFMNNDLMVSASSMLVINVLFFFIAGIIGAVLSGILTLMPSISAIPFLNPGLSIVYGIAFIVLMAYSLYLSIKLVSEQFDISMGKAAAAVLIPLILLVILFAILWVIYMLLFSFAALMAMIGLAGA